MMSGERRLMYCTFKKIYRDEDPDGILSSLLYAYLLIKNEFQRELVQTNDYVGFGNFNDYEYRKSHFLKEGSVYEHLLLQTAICSSVGSCTSSNYPGKRYMETRITPKNSSLHNTLLIRYLDNITHFISGDLSHLFSKNNESVPNPWDYVFHFIKKKDKEYKTCSEHLQHPRNWEVRAEVKKQAMALDTLRHFNHHSAKRIAGIDAASSELFCRPEVFAHAFRFLRESNHPPFMLERPLPPLGVTYHVGEDFYDIVDGLRAVREAVLFLRLGSGDRIGHGLVLGTDVRNYYQKRHWKIAMPKQCILDNIAFMLSESNELDGFEKVQGSLERLFLKYFNSLYGRFFSEMSPLTYYQACMLRGDDPELYTEIDGVYKYSRATPWERTHLDEISPELRNARKIRTARYLNHLYHYNHTVKCEGQKYDQVELSEDLINLIVSLQEKVLSEIEHKEISIESNPTSNYKIGDIQQFCEHPVTSFYTLPSDRTKTPHHICVSINTDDKGVFPTSLEREFALLASALIQEYDNDRTLSPPREILQWLDEIREMAFEMRFNRNS